MKKAFYIGLICLPLSIYSCQEPQKEYTVSMSPAEYSAPFQWQYDNALYEIEILNKKLKSKELELGLLLENYTEENHPLQRKKKKFDADWDKIYTGIQKIQFDLESKVPGYEKGKFLFDSIPAPHSNEQNSAYLRGVTGSIASELAISIKELNLGLSNPKYLLEAEDSVWSFQAITDPSSPNAPNPVYWEDRALIYAPIVACLNELKQIERRLIQTRLNYYAYLIDNIRFPSYVFSNVSPFMYAESDQVEVGEEILLKMGLKAWRNEDNLTYIINGDTITSIKNGEASYRFKADEAGRKRIKGIIQYPDPKSGIMKEATYQYYIKVIPKSE